MGAAANPNMVTNPFQQASQAQMGALQTQGNAIGAMAPAMNRIGQGLTQTAAEGMATYQNPYEDQVVQASMRDIGNQGLKMQNTLGAQATAAGAFGGSRHGIAESELAKGTQQQMLDQAARLRQQGFNTALGASQADMASQLGAAGQLGGAAGQLAGLGQGLAGLGQASFGYGQAINQQQMQQGALQQAAMQSLIDAAKNQYQGYTKGPQAGLATMFGGAGLTEGTKGSSSTYQPGLMDYLTMGAEAGAKLYGM